MNNAMRVQRQTVCNGSVIASLGPRPTPRWGLWTSAWSSTKESRQSHIRRAVQTEGALEQLFSWAASNNVATDKVFSTVSLDTDAPLLVAARDLSPGEAVLTVPDTAWLTPSVVQSSRLGPYVRDLEPWLQLCLYLLSEKDADTRTGSRSTSSFGRYISSLPATLDSPLFWSDEDLSLLDGTQLLQSLQGYKQFFHQRFQELEQQLFAANRDTFPAAAFSYHNFLWAAATVRGRLHAPLDTADAPALVPLADALPHKRAATTEWRLKQGGLFGRSRELVVQAARAVRKGEVLSLNYGADKLDGALLLDYGVMDAESAQGGYTLTLTLPASDRFYDDKADILERAGLAPSWSWQLRRGAAPAEDMLGFLRLMQLSGSDAFLLEPIFEAEVWGHMCQPVSAGNEAAVCGAMLDGARDALERYSTSIGDDVDALRQLGGGSGARGMAIRMRLGEKEALDTLLAYFEGQQQRLGQVEYYQERRLKRLGLVDDDRRSTYDSFFKDGIA